MRQQALEKKRQQEQLHQRQALEKKQREAAAKVKREAEVAAEKQRQQALARLRANAQSNIANQLAENARVAAARTARQQYVQSEFEKYSGLIVTEISRHWNQANIDPSLNALIQVNVDVTGDILSVKIVKSSGNALFDRQAKLAVLSAGRLPMPTDKEVAQRFLSFQFHFTPRGVS
ncbi:cell envelope integrity protein TolA [Piscirickettsia salmonis]|uniref:cell envelope integrity protein TolA n=1 Tax=Piscirickettsia salmonis TaxID=1238 RepID=UPI000F098F46|nr:protein TolA [Piscirickettsia salmonis]RNC78895.1 cell envelope integrity protein TolA [Piscirickettsiaceae bacterium NZ-RLO2]